MPATTDRSKARGRVRVETGAKRVRAYLGGELVADTTRPTLVWEGPHYPVYYFPLEDVRGELIEDGGVAHSPSRGNGRTFTVRAGGNEAPGAALRYENSPIPELRDAVRLDWDAMDAWFEEDEQVFTHARNPYTRIDILPSSRHIRIEVDGVTVAESTNARLLFETGLRTRYYLPKPHVRMDLLVQTPSATYCPYKGTAEWWSVRVGGKEYPDLAWSYRMPLPESQKIAGLVAFYDEKVDVYVDGVLQGK
ncbi:MAG TPA: DUF427 domain-containing protein [Solirubrobacterales bacterium]